MPPAAQRLKNPRFCLQPKSAVQCHQGNEQNALMSDIHTTADQQILPKVLPVAENGSPPPPNNILLTGYRGVCYPLAFFLKSQPQTPVVQNVYHRHMGKLSPFRNP